MTLKWLLLLYINCLSNMLRGATLSKRPGCYSRASRLMVRKIPLVQHCTSLHSLSVDESGAGELGGWRNIVTLVLSVPSIWLVGWKTGKSWVASAKRRGASGRGVHGWKERRWHAGKEQLAKFGKVKEAHEEDAAEHTTLSVYVPTRHFTTAAAISVCVCLLGGGWMIDLMISHGRAVTANTIKLLPVYIIDKFSLPSRRWPFK